MEVVCEQWPLTPPSNLHIFGEPRYNRSATYSQASSQGSRADCAVMKPPQEHQQQQARTQSCDKSPLPPLQFAVNPSPLPESKTNWTSTARIYNALVEALKTQKHYDTLLHCSRWKGLRYNVHTGNEEQVLLMHVRLDTNVHAFLTNKDRRISLPQWNYTEAVELDTLEKTRDTCVEALKWVCLTFPRTRSARISSKFMQVSFIPMLRHFLVAV
jgi:hypothetical protein